MLETQNASKGERAGVAFALCEEIVQRLTRFNAMLRTYERVRKVIVSEENLTPNPI